MQAPATTLRRSAAQHPAASLQWRSLQLEELLERPASALALADPLRPVFASLLVGRSMNEGVLPETLGLTRDTFGQLMREYFPGPALRLQDGAAQDLDSWTGVRPGLLDRRQADRAG